MFRKQPGMVIARQKVAVEDGSYGTIVMQAGERVAADHPIVRNNPELFQVDHAHDRAIERIAELAQDPANREEGAHFGVQRPSRNVDTPRESALRTLERNAEHFATGSDVEIDNLIRHHDPTENGARYIAAVGDENYNSAFGKLLRHGPWAAAQMTAGETAAMEAVNGAERALNVGTGSAGQFAIPLQIDPSIVMSGAGSLNPWRSVATVRTMVSDTLRLVASDGTTASYVPEGQEAADASPVLTQPTINAARGQCFVPFSWEISQDWGSLQSEIGKLIADARDVVDAQQFVTGNGVDAPIGVLAIGTTGSLTATQRVLTTGTASYAVADGWNLKAQLPPRAIGRSTYAAAPATWDSSYRFVGGNSTEPLQFDVGRGGAYLGSPKIEASGMVATTTTGSRIMLAGDMGAFVIADRIGLSVSVIPHLFGASQRPTGSGGLFAFWRTGSVVAAPSLLRYLEVK